MSYVEPIEASEVKTPDDLIEFVRSRYGVIVNWKEKAKFKAQLKDFLNENPHVDISILVKAAQWGKDTRRKMRSLHGVFYLASTAYAAGALPELDPEFAERSSIEDEIIDALQVETDDGWRTRLICSVGPNRVRALEEWRERAASLAVAS